MSVDQMSVDQMSVDQMSVDQMSVDQMSVGQMLFDEKTWNQPPDFLILTNRFSLESIPIRENNATKLVTIVKLLLHLSLIFVGKVGAYLSVDL
jgi:hypothetical protein